MHWVLPESDKHHNAIYIKDNKLLSTVQYGFKNNFSTADAIYDIINMITKAYMGEIDLWKFS